MQGKSKFSGGTAAIRSSLLLGVFFFLSGTPTWAAEQDQEKVGFRGNPAQLLFEGLEAYTPDEIRNGLGQSFDYRMAAHRAGPLDRFVATLRELILAGYMDGGFPDALIEAAVSGETGRITITVNEGPRYLCGGVALLGGRTLSGEALTERLTRAPSLPTTAAPFVRDESGNREGFESLPTPPIWDRGKPAPFSGLSRQRLKERVKKAFRDLGFFFPDFDLEIGREEDGTATLRVVINDEGPKGVVGRIDVRGQKKNSREEIIDFLGIKPGRDIDVSLLAELEKKLRDSARFLECSVNVPPPAEGADGLSLLISVEEYVKAPPLSESFSRNELVFLKMGRWLAEFGSRDEDFSIDTAAEEGGPFLRFVLSHEKGIFFEIMIPSSQHSLPLHYAIIISPEKVVLISPCRRTILPLADQLIEVIIPLAITSDDSNPDRPFAFVFAPSFSSPAAQNGSKPSTPIPLCRIETDLLPTAFVGMAHLEGIDVDENEGILVARGEKTMFKIDRETGRLLELTLSVFDGSGLGSLRGRFEKGVFEATVNAFLQTCEGYTRESEPGRSISALGVFLGTEILNHSASAGGEAAADDQPKGEQTAGAVASLARHLVLKSLDRLRLGDVPPPFRVLSRRPSANMMGIIAQMGLPLAYRLFPSESWPCTLTTESLLFACGKGLHTRAELQRLYESDRIGPVGYCAAAHLLTLVNGQMAKAFAARGLDLLSAEGFRRDCRALIEGDSVLGDCLLESAESLRSLTAGERDALAAAIGGSVGKILGACTARLQAPPRRPIVEALPEALEPLWEQTLKPRIEASLRGILEE
jgi:hypothetical protein